MLKDLLKAILFITIFLLICNLIGFIQQLSNSMPEYMFFITLISFIIMAWVYVIKLVKYNGGI